MEQRRTAPHRQNRHHFFENKKNELLAAFYKKDDTLVEKTYRQIFERACKIQNFSENDLKRLNQIQRIFKQFIPDLIRQRSSNLENHRFELSRLITQNIRHGIHNVQHIHFDQWEQKCGLSDVQKQLLYKTAMTFQLTSGCSNFCRRCNEWALPGVRKHFSFSAIASILDEMLKQKNEEISLFGASDPLDWEEDKKTILDVVKLAENKHIEYSVLTKVPKGKSRLLKRLIRHHTNLSISVTAKNKARIATIQDTEIHALSKQHDTDDLLIPAGLDEDFTSIKPSITDGYGTEITPDGAFIIIPTFTSALYPFGHKKIKITPDTDFFPMKKTGRHALLVDYFKPLGGYDLTMTPIHMTALLDVQIESIILDNGRDELTPPGMRSTKEYLSIFEEKARRQRKKMTLSVIKRLKKEYLSGTKFKNMDQAKQEEYQKKVQRHLELCKHDNCLKSKLYTLSFFLKAVEGYTRKNQIKIPILRFLLKDEIQKNETAVSGSVSSNDVAMFFSGAHQNPFEMFRFFIGRMLVQSDETSDYFQDPLLSTLFQTYPATYDPVADLFVEQTSQI